MTLNGVMTVIVRYFIEFGSLWANYVNVIDVVGLPMLCNKNVAYLVFSNM